MVKHDSINLSHLFPRREIVTGKLRKKKKNKMTQNGLYGYKMATSTVISGYFPVVCDFNTTTF